MRRQRKATRARGKLCSIPSLKKKKGKREKSDDFLRLCRVNGALRVVALRVTLVVPGVKTLQARWAYETSVCSRVLEINLAADVTH